MALKIEYTIGPQRDITLDEIRELVAATEDWPGGLSVTFKTDPGDPRDPTTHTVSVRKQ